MNRADRTILAIAQAFFSIVIVAAVAFIFGACCSSSRSSQFMPTQCPETARTYCPAQHFDSARARGGR